MNTFDNALLFKPFWICHDDDKRTFINSDIFEQFTAPQGTSEHSYDTLTTRITTDTFHAKVDALVASHLYGDDHTLGNRGDVPFLGPLTAADTFLTPEPFTPKLLGIISPWIDLCSPDPIIYGISRQVLKLEVAFATFCGLAALSLPTPRVSDGHQSAQALSLYANALKEALNSTPFHMSLSVRMPMMEIISEELLASTGLEHLARPEYASSPGKSRGKLETTAQSPNEASQLAQDSVGHGVEDARSSVDTVRKRIRVHDFLGSWDTWNTIRTFCEHHPRLYIDLQIPKYLPPSSICFRWYSEPLRILSLHAATFFTNAKGFPVLTANHRALINLYLKSDPKQTPCILLGGLGPQPFEPQDLTEQTSTTHSTGTFTTSGIFDGPTPSESEANQSRRRSFKSLAKKDTLAFLKYLRWFEDHRPPKTYLEIKCSDYEDYLQAPLQPLADDLESFTYETFEQDPVKYYLYEQAIAKALLDWQAEGKPVSGRNSRIVVAVVGAGRGPLVTRALQASESTGVPIDVWALEKNPNAFVILQRQNASLWNNRVHLVHSDMRQWEGPVYFEPLVEGVENQATQPQACNIDIVISELLGSFGDNELSPECLDSVVHLLNPTHGISIPQSYSAWLTPIATPKLHAEFRRWKTTDPHAFSTASVVCLQKFDYLSARPHSSVKGPDIMPSSTSQLNGAPPAEYAASREDDDNGQFVTKPPTPNVKQAWSFHHGPRSSLSPYSENRHNTRHSRLSFDLRHRGVCHGLAGYFEAVLYPGVELSTNPVTQEEKSLDMMSWFPIFFPLTSPLYVPDNSTLIVSMFRETDNRKIWYEWMVEGWANLPSTTGGTGYRLGCTEMMSSKEKGCMM